MGYAVKLRPHYCVCIIPLVALDASCLGRIFGDAPLLDSDPAVLCVCVLVDPVWIDSVLLPSFGCLLLGVCPRTDLLFHWTQAWDSRGWVGFGALARRSTAFPCLVWPCLPLVPWTFPMDLSMGSDGGWTRVRLDTDRRRIRAEGSRPEPVRKGEPRRCVGFKASFSPFHSTRWEDHEAPSQTREGSFLWVSLSNRSLHPFEHPFEPEETRFETETDAIAIAWTHARERPHRTSTFVVGFEDGGRPRKDVMEDGKEDLWMEVPLPNRRNGADQTSRWKLATDAMEDGGTCPSIMPPPWRRRTSLGSHGTEDLPRTYGTGGGGARGMDGGVITWQLVDANTLEVVVGRGQRQSRTLELQLPTEEAFPKIDGRVRPDGSAKVAALGADERLYILNVPGKESMAARSTTHKNEWMPEDVQVRDLSMVLGKVGTIETLCMGGTYVAIGGQSDAVLLVPDEEDQEPKVLKEPTMQKLWKGLAMRGQAGHVVRLVSCISGMGNYLVVIRSSGTVCLWSTDTCRWMTSVNIEPSAWTDGNVITEACLEEEWGASPTQPHCLVHLCAASGSNMCCYQLAMSWKNRTQVEVSVHRRWHSRALGEVNRLKIALEKVWVFTSGDVDSNDAGFDEDALWWAPLVDGDASEVQLVPVLPFDWEVKAWMPGASEEAENNAWKRVFAAYTARKSRRAFTDAVLSDGIYCRKSMSAVFSFLGQNISTDELSALSPEGCRSKVLEGIDHFLTHSPETGEVDLWYQVLQRYWEVWHMVHAPLDVFCSADGSAVFVHRGESVTLLTVGDPVEFHAAGLAAPWRGALEALSEIGNQAASLMGSTGLSLLEASALEPDFCTSYLPRLVSAGIGRAPDCSPTYSNELLGAKSLLERFKAQKVVASVLKSFHSVQLSNALISEMLLELRHGYCEDDLEYEPMEERNRGSFLSLAISARFRRLVSLRLRYVSKMLVALECASASISVETEEMDFLYEELILLLRHFSILKWLSSTVAEESNRTPSWMSFNHVYPGVRKTMQEGASFCRGMSLFELTATSGPHANSNLSGGDFVSQSAVLAMRQTFAVGSLEHSVIFSDGDAWPEEMLAGVALGLCQYHQLDALSRMLNIFEGAVHESSSPILVFVRGLWHCAMMQKADSKQAQEIHLKHALSSFSRAVPVLHFQQSNFRVVITNIVQALTRNQAEITSSGLALRTIYSEGLMLFFERLGCPEGAQHFGTLCARSLSHLDMDPASNIMATSKTWNNNLSYALQLENYEEAYAMMGLVKNPTSALECLRHLVLALCSGKDCLLLQSLPFAGVVTKTLPDGKSSKTCIAKETVKTLLGHAELSSLKSHPHPYYILSSFLQQRCLLGTSWMVLSANARRAKIEWKPSMGTSELRNTVSSFSMAKCTLLANDEEVISVARQTRGPPTTDDRSKRRRLSSGMTLPPRLGSKMLESLSWEHGVGIEYALTVALLSLTKLGIAPPATVENVPMNAARLIPVLLSKRLYKEAIVLCTVGIPVQEQAQVLEEIFSSIAHTVTPRDILLHEDLASSYTHEESSQEFIIDAPTARHEKQGPYALRAGTPGKSGTKAAEYHDWLSVCRSSRFLNGVLLSERPDMPVSHWLSWALKGGSLPTREFALLLHFHLRHRMHTEGAEWALDYLQSDRGDSLVQWLPYGLLEMLLSNLEVEKKQGGTAKSVTLFPLLASELSRCIEKSRAKG